MFKQLFSSPVNPLQTAFERHCHLIPAMLEKEPKAVAHFVDNEEAFRALFHGLSHDDTDYEIRNLPAAPSPDEPPMLDPSDMEAMFAQMEALADPDELLTQRYWTPLRQVAFKHPQWIVRLLETRGVRSRYRWECKELMQELWRGAMASGDWSTEDCQVVGEFATGILLKRVKAPEAWREPCVLMVARCHPPGTVEMLADVLTHDRSWPVRLAVLECISGREQFVHPVMVPALEAAFAHKGYRSVWCPDSRASFQNHLERCRAAAC